MSQVTIGETVADVPSLRGVFVTAMPDCLLYDSWVRPDETWHAEDVASHFGDLVRANREGLKGLSAWSTDMQVTIESSGVLLVLRESGDFVVALAFERDAPLGMVRIHVKRILERLEEVLPKVAPEELPRGVRVVSFLQKYAPDPHTVLRRVVLRTGIPFEALQAPETLDAAQVRVLEDAVRGLLGLESLTL